MRVSKKVLILRIENDDFDKLNIGTYMLLWFYIN